MVLAERYQMDELKQLCEEKLCSLVDKNNIAEMLYLADLYNCPFLKTAVVDVVRYILVSYEIPENISDPLSLAVTHKMDVQLRINKAYVMGTQSWQMLKESNPKLMNEVMERVVLGAETASPPPNKRQRQHFSSSWKPILSEVLSSAATHLSEAAEVLSLGLAEELILRYCKCGKKILIFAFGQGSSAILSTIL
uniref:Uncharacterized protein n=1 Tax=Parascaris equorum TaxID=6256 RepID=A0A914RJY5_PAREQ